MPYFKRLQTFSGLKKNQSAFLWGPRQTGKSTLLHELYPNSLCLNLLDPDTYDTWHKNPAYLRDLVLASDKLDRPIIIDEIQKFPKLLDIVQWLIDEKKLSFILTGSSVRKLVRGGGNLLGGRCWRYEMFPFSFAEIPDFDLMRALNHGLLPRSYLADDAQSSLQAYVSDYLKEEIFAEALTRNSQAFSQFIEKAAFSNGEIVNYSKIASECGVRSSTVKDYFQILEDTLIGRFVPSFRLKPKRRVILAPKFYYFDVGIANFLLKRGGILPQSELMGRTFEHFILQELWAHKSYHQKQHDISYWRTTSGLEVDFILGKAEIAVEVKATREVTSHHLKGMKQFCDEYKPKHALIVCLEPLLRKSDNITVVPWKLFLEKLWSDKWL